MVKHGHGRYDRAMAKNKEDLITMKEAAELAGVSYRTVSRWVKLGYLTRHADARGRVRVSSAAVKAMGAFQKEPSGAN